ncbi:MAG TPA: glycosyltransferase [Candidatus Binataceae bacterium]|nr:glycosyltransferase [Candidatus Binataceae bacterium]
MDRLNAELARFLLRRGTPVHLVSHYVAPDLTQAGAIAHLVPKTADSFFAAEWYLEASARFVLKELCNRQRARALVNGGNCAWPAINWVHCVHHRWPPRDDGAPAWFRLKNRIAKLIARRRETRALAVARVVIANSQRTRRELGEIGVSNDKIAVVYPGVPSGFELANQGQRSASRAALGQSQSRPLLVFVGGLGFDLNKGFDTLWQAWRELCTLPEWEGNLLVAGGGRRLEHWRTTVAAAQLQSRVTFLGLTDRVAEVLAAADLLVSPVRYEAYGLNVHEALCRGVPAIVSASAGVAERFAPELRDLLLRDPDNASELAQRMLTWHRNRKFWRAQIEPTARVLRAHGASEMAQQIVSLCEADTSTSVAAPLTC